jgi:hypothetical protein
MKRIVSYVIRSFKQSTRRKLRGENKNPKGNKVLIEGIECLEFSVVVTGIQPGDLYMAKRNTGWQLLTCERRVSDNVLDYVVAKEIAYSYDARECFKVVK